jgi:hypothetical protein
LKDLVRNLRKRVIRKARKKSLSDPVQNEARMSALSYKSSGGEVMRKKTKGYQAGGKMKAKGMKAGGKMPMVKKGGEMVPAFAADGVGKMMAGGKTGGMKISPKMMANGGVARVQMREGGNTVARGSGAARPQKFTKNG